MNNRTLVVFSTLLVSWLVCPCSLCPASTFSSSVPAIPHANDRLPNVAEFFGPYQAGYATADAVTEPSYIWSALTVQSRSSNLTTSLSLKSAFNLDGFTITGPPGQIPVSLTMQVHYQVYETQDSTPQYTNTPWSASISLSSSLQDSLESVTQNIGTFAVGTNNVVTSATGGFAGEPAGTIDHQGGSFYSRLDRFIYITTPAILYNVGDPSLTIGVDLTTAAMAGGPLFDHDVQVWAEMHPVHLNPLNLPPGYVVNSPDNMFFDNIYVPEPSALLLAAMGVAGLAVVRLRQVRRKKTRPRRKEAFMRLATLTV